MADHQYDSTAGTCADTGTTSPFTIVAASTVPGYQPIDGNVTSGHHVGYRRETPDRSEWEQGRATYNAATREFTRTDIYATSNNDTSPVNFTANTNVYIVPDATAIGPIATQAEAEAGSSSEVRRFTPQLIAQAIAALETGPNSIPDPFYYKSSYLIPILIVATGQSNISMSLGGQYTISKTIGYPTSNVQTWQHASDPEDATDSAAWQDYDPEGAYFGADTVGDTTPPFLRGLGYIQDQRGSCAMDMAEELYSRTGRPVYVVQTYRNGTSITYWDADSVTNHPTQELRQWTHGRVCDAITDLQATWPEITFADVVIWGQGDADYNTLTNSQYSTLWSEWYEDCIDPADTESGAVFGWIDREKTKVLLQESAPQYRDSGNGWAGQHRVEQDNAENVILMGGVGIELQPDAVHYTADGGQVWGKRAADLVMGITHPKRNQYSEDQEDIIAYNANVIDFSQLIPEADMTYTADPGAVLDMTDDQTHNYTDPKVRRVIDYRGNHVINTSAPTGGYGSVFYFNQIIKPDAGMTVGSYEILTDYSVIQSQVAASSSVSTNGTLRAILLAPQYGVATSDLTAVWNLGDCEAIRYAGAGLFLGNGGTVNIDNRRGYIVDDFTAGGFYGAVNITKQAGVVVDDLTHATNNTAILIGTETIPTGDYAAYQDNDTPTRLNGGYRTAFKTASVDTTLTVNDFYLEMTHATVARTVTLPALSSVEAGWRFEVARTGAAVVSIDANGSETIRGSTSAVTIPAVNDVAVIVSRGSDWAISFRKYV